MSDEPPQAKGRINPLDPSDGAQCHSAPGLPPRIQEPSTSHRGPLCSGPTPTTTPSDAKDDDDGVLAMPTIESPDAVGGSFSVPGVYVDEDASLASSTASTGRAVLVPRLTCVLPNHRLYLGAQRSITGTQCEEYGISAFLCVAAELDDSLPACIDEEDVERGTVKHMHLLLEDSHRTQLGNFTDRALEFIDKNLAAQRGVVVYCQQGQSRSVSIVLAFMMRELRITCERALDRLRQVYRAAEPNLSFIMQLKERELTFSASCES